MANDAVLKNALVQAHYTTGLRDPLITPRTFVSYNSVKLL